MRNVRNSCWQWQFIAFVQFSGRLMSPNRHLWLTRLVNCYLRHQSRCAMCIISWAMWWSHLPPRASFTLTKFSVFTDIFSFGTSLTSLLCLFRLFLITSGSQTVIATGNEKRPCEFLRLCQPRRTISGLSLPFRRDSCANINRIFIESAAHGETHYETSIPFLLPFSAENASATWNRKIRLRLVHRGFYGNFLSYF